MQIDFHHTVIYVLARIANFNHHDANIISYSSQYVDDATNFGFIHFDNDNLYFRISSAHKTLDARNFENSLDHMVWLPFHFLPGNVNTAIKKSGTDDEKFTCSANSKVAQEMINDTFKYRNKPYALHKLGISLHTYADTWAHSGFAGIISDINKARLIEDKKTPWYRILLDKIVGFFIGELLPLGHATVLSNPDLPYLQWKYKNYKNETVVRNNSREFLEAACNIYSVLVSYNKGLKKIKQFKLNNKDKNTIYNLFITLTDENAKARHEKWLKAIKDGSFSFGKSKLSYIAKGKGSWKYEAIGTENEHDEESEIFPYKKSFLKSNWKLFHDALMLHRFVVLNNILPKFNICAA